MITAVAAAVCYIQCTLRRLEVCNQKRDTKLRPISHRQNFIWSYKKLAFAVQWRILSIDIAAGRFYDGKNTVYRTTL